MFERRGASGVALRVGSRVVGYAYYVVSGRLGVLAGLDVARHEAPAGAGEALLQAALRNLRQHDVTRIESPFLSFDSDWAARRVCQGGVSPLLARFFAP